MCWSSDRSPAAEGRIQSFLLLTNQQSSSSAAGRHARPTAPGNDAPASRIHHGSLAVVPQLQADTAAGWPRQRNHRQQPVVSVFHCSSTATSGGNQMPAAVVRHELVRLSPALISAGHSSRLLRQLAVTYVMSRYILSSASCKSTLQQANPGRHSHMRMPKVYTPMMSQHSSSAAHQLLAPVTV